MTLGHKLRVNELKCIQRRMIFVSLWYTQILWINPNGNSRVIDENQIPYKHCCNLERGVSDQFSTSTSRKLASILDVSKNVLNARKLSKLCGSVFIRCGPRSACIVRTRSVFSLLDRRDEKRARVANSGLMYQE
ncbi:hypothetical protein HELRODRAFT_180329 [Helobdella robusta]|uniref:Uncharacterized protein n=1 Tax=Helobdella robusta TaxID=6412 RepID=T1FFR4_HELRO|nr:hypothetical protein HELRODRAFT_180329 [Helobdella robusta]ESN93923.1 hypothetical protein HELRODRAFT_180329 [Helobdella robusta]